MQPGHRCDTGGHGQRSVRPQPLGPAARRQPAHRDAGLVVRPQHYRTLWHAHGRPDHRCRTGGRGRAAGRSRGARAGLGRAGHPPVKAFRALSGCVGRAGGRRSYLPRCSCTRREIREAGAAPHGEIDLHRYPGTCRSLGVPRGAGSPAEFPRSPALRLDAQEAEVSVVDRLLGPLTSVVDDFVLQRGDGVAAYNLAVVVDDAAEGVEEVVRRRPAALHAPTGVAGSPARAAHPGVCSCAAGPGASWVSAWPSGTVRSRWPIGGRWARAPMMCAGGGLQPRPDREGECPTMVDLLDRFDPAALPAEPRTFDPSGDQPAVDPFA